MKRLILALSTLALLACQQDAYDKGEGKYSLLKAELVEAHADATKQIDYVVTDEDQQLALTQPHAAKWVTTADSTYRALLYYNKVDDRRAEVVNMAQIPTASILSPDDLKEPLKTDAVKLESVWRSTTKKYVNVGIVLMTGEAPDATAKHSLAIVAQRMQMHADGKRTLAVVLHHNRNGMPEYYSMRTYFSIPIKNVEADSLQVCFHTYDGEVAKTFSVR